MESDSESDGSHISTTPPRHPSPPPVVSFSQQYKLKLTSLISTLNPMSKPSSKSESKSISKSKLKLKKDPVKNSRRGSKPTKELRNAVELDEYETANPKSNSNTNPKFESKLKSKLNLKQDPVESLRRGSKPTKELRKSVELDQSETLNPNFNSNLKSNSKLKETPVENSSRGSKPIKIARKSFESDLLNPSNESETRNPVPAWNRSSKPTKVALNPLDQPESSNRKENAEPTSNWSSKPTKVARRSVELELQSPSGKSETPEAKSKWKENAKATSDQSSKPAKFARMSERSETKIKTFVSTSNQESQWEENAKPTKISPLSDPGKPKENPEPIKIDRIRVEPDRPSQLPFPIISQFDQNEGMCDNNLVKVNAGGFCPSKFASFSKTQKTNFTLEPIEDDSMSMDTNRVKTENVAKAVKKHPNLICGSSVQALPVKRSVKCSNEGNFVRLNINGYGGSSKFKRVGKNRNFTSRKSYRWGKRKFGKSGKNSEEKGDGQEDGLVQEKGLRSEEEDALIEEVVLGVRNEVSDENLLKLLKVTHGYDSFRDGQLEAIKMVLSGKSTMLVLPTGAGKSLCYQLPAMVLPGITLVVSPLVALMVDQLKNLPLMIGGGLLSSNQTLEEMSETLRLLQEGSIKVLFVSPERFLNAEFLSICSTTLLISLVVVDEAHCVSEWSHNFRPSYMRLRASLLRTKLNVECILAMTATATTKTLYNVMNALEIPSSNLVKTTQWRDNLQLSVSVSKHRMNDLMTLIKSPPYAEIKSIIIYCKFQAETDSVSKYLRDNNISSRSYHSGIPSKDRSTIQKTFCSGKIKVVVATVAFGMGLDKRDVGAVIHYSLPESLEEYVQEIGRAGRDGRLSYCHLLFDDSTYFFLRSLTYSEGVDEYAVSRFLSEVFTTDLDSKGKLCSLVKESASRKFDMKEEVMLTILTQLELGEVQYLNVLPQINVTCTLNFHQTTPGLLAAKDLVIAAILKKSDTKHGQYVFDVPSVANTIGVSAFDIINHLQTFKAKGEITYEMKDQAYCYTIVDAPKDLVSLAAHITKWLSDVEISKVRKIDTMFNAAAFAVQECKKMGGCKDSLHTPCLQNKILDYFEGNEDMDIPNKMEQSSRFLRADIKVFLQSNSQAKFTPRAIARIMHGIASPAYPSATWSRTHFWGRYMRVDFNAVMEAAKAELLSFVNTDRF